MDADHRHQSDEGSSSTDRPDVADLAQAVVDAVTRTGAAGGSAALGAVESGARALVSRVIDDALAQPRPVEDRRRLAKALRQGSSGPVLGGAAAAGLATKVARRLGPARFAARRTPLWLAVTVVPAVASSLTRGADELALVASHLVLRARANGVEPDRDRLRRVAVQVVTGRPARPDEEPSHGPLAVAWARRAVRATLPFASGVKTKDPAGMAEAAATVDPWTLRPTS